MKLQHLTVIFALIFLPIILITSYYISRQVDTINLQLSYDSSLLDATYDAMTAFEINTANEDLSTVADSLRSIIEASTNIFLNTLSTNLGYSNASKNYIQPYIPAILYTLYDGYYIYSPASVPNVCTDKYGQTISTDSYGVSYAGSTSSGVPKYNFTQSSVVYQTDSEGNVTSTEAIDGPLLDYDTLTDSAKLEYGSLLYENKDGTYSATLHEGGSDATKYVQDYILKSYVPYSAEYSRGNIDVTINYTLDNFISITGTIGSVYYTKSGYLINNNLISTITVDGSAISWSSYSEEEIVSLINSDDHEVIVNFSDGTPSISNQDSSNITNIVIEDTRDAIEYYAKAWMFSKWVYDNLGSLEEKDVQDSGLTFVVDGSVKNDFDNTALASSLLYDFSDSSKKIFSTSENPEDDESNFYEHKRNVIKNSINYNLALAMVSYSQMSTLQEYDMPIFAETEWDVILNNISIVSFMQGFNCGLKYYNNYAIATSVNNEVTVTTNEIYYVPIKVEDSAFLQEDGTTIEIYTDITDSYYYETAHRIDCEELEAEDDGIEYYISFKSKEIKYDKLYDNELSRYTYDHKAYLDYSCIVNSNYTFLGTNGKTYTGNSGLEETIEYLSDNKKRAYRIAVGKERNNLYKSLDYDTNYGYEILNNLGLDNVSSATITGYTRSLSEIYCIEVIIENTSNDTENVYTDNMNIEIGSNKYSSVIPTTSISTLTREYYISETGSYSIKISFDQDATKTSIKSVKIYYK